MDTAPKRYKLRTDVTQLSITSNNRDGANEAFQVIRLAMGLLRKRSLERFSE